MTIWNIGKKILITLGKPWWNLIKFLFKTLRKIHISFRWKWGFGMGTILLLAISGALVWFNFAVLVQLPNINLIYTPPKLTTIITDNQDKVLYKFYDGENRSWVGIKDIPKSMINATLAVEDKDFYTNQGFSIKGLISAAWYDLKNKNTKMRGGSTITQQLIKNVFLTDEQTWTRKAKELILAVEAERQFSKDEILERYLNQVAFGGDVYGIEEAAQKYFGKNIKDVTPAEAAMLAGLIAAPSSYSPINGNIQFAYQRQKEVIGDMVNDGMIDKKTADSMISEKISIKSGEIDLEAPHFVFYVRQYVEDNFNLGDIPTRGLKIVTTLNSQVQDEAEIITKDEVTKAKGLGFSNGAALVTNPKTGAISAMVGSKDYWATDIDGKYNVTTAQRQPGSSIKPINYLLAFEKGKTLITPIDDSPVTYNIAGQKPYTPRDYTGKFLGTVTLETALASSLNIPSVKLLAEDGVNNMIDLAQKMGITTWDDRSRFGLSLALGAGEVKMTDMAEAYGTFANLGYRVPLNPIKEIDNYLGETIYTADPEQIQVAPAEDTFLVDTALSSNEARTPIFGPNSKLVIPGKTVAVKTGTTNNLKDNWCIGWTPSVLVATWVGNNDATPMSWVASGVSGATPIWNRIMNAMLKNKSDEPWQVPVNIEKSNVCGKDGIFVKGTEGNVTCPAAPTPTPEK